MNCNNCGYCGQCQEKKKCANPCSCAEPVFSLEAMPDDPNTLRFNVNGKSVWYDFEPVTKAGETCTTIATDAIHRLLKYNGECGEQTITGKELGSILHLADIGDVNVDSIEDYGILNYRKDQNCGEGCEGVNTGWVSTNPVNVGKQNLEYILGSFANGELHSLMPPTDANHYNYLVWAGSGKAKWEQIFETSVIPTTTEVDGGGNSHTYTYPVYYDPETKALVFYKKEEPNE